MSASENNSKTCHVCNKDIFRGGSSTPRDCSLCGKPVCMMDSNGLNGQYCCTLCRPNETALALNVPKLHTATKKVAVSAPRASEGQDLSAMPTTMLGITQAVLRDAPRWVSIRNGNAPVEITEDELIEARCHDIDNANHLLWWQRNKAHLIRLLEAKAFLKVRLELCGERAAGLSYRDSPLRIAAIVEAEPSTAAVSSIFEAFNLFVFGHWVLHGEKTTDWKPKFDRFVQFWRLSSSNIDPFRPKILSLEVFTEEEHAQHKKRVADAVSSWSDRERLALVRACSEASSRGDTDEIVRLQHTAQIFSSKRALH